MNARKQQFLAESPIIPPQTPHQTISSTEMRLKRSPLKPPHGDSQRDFLGPQIRQRDCHPPSHCETRSKLPLHVWAAEIYDVKL
jgi:hypothetical protein